jgi:hypothetical protein
MKARGCVAAFLIVGITTIVAPQMLRAQDSGPGPVPPATEAIYDATLIRLFANLTGSLTFSAGEGGEGTFTSGPFEAEVGGTLVVGTWQAIDVGDFSLWTAQASGETSTFLAAGFATPTNLVGQATTNAAGGRSLRYVLIGEAVVEPPPPPPPAT